MSLRPRVSPSLRRPSVPWRSTAAWIALVLSACSPGANGPAASSQAAIGLAASSVGVCQAIRALPDVTAAERAFTNVAHEALHGLAADPRLSRSVSARVLEAMQKVEADFGGPSGASALGDDLAELQVSTNAALGALGQEVPACAN
jgi:hypothetical protein